MLEEMSSRDTKNFLQGIVLCYATTQLTGLFADDLFTTGLCLPRSFDAVVFWLGFLFIGLIVTILPTAAFAVVMTFAARRIHRRGSPWYWIYLLAVGLTLLIFFAMFPFFSTFHPPDRWFPRFPSKAEWATLAADLVAGLLGVGSLHIFWKRRMETAQLPTAPYSEPSTRSPQG
ncbi:MAG: hypothetical protein HY343_09295 [Lentisphaerae bacterium]|nr:hypothetical protein [Lentisphaerota bacterium]